MATIEECRAALDRLSSIIAGGAARKGSTIPERTVSATVRDLGVVFTGRIDTAGFHDISTDPAPRAQLRLATTSDDLVAMAAGELSFGHAWSRGRLKVEASFGDLLRLRSVF